MSATAESRGGERGREEGNMLVSAGQRPYGVKAGGCLKTHRLGGHSIVGKMHAGRRRGQTQKNA